MSTAYLPPAARRPVAARPAAVRASTPAIRIRWDRLAALAVTVLVVLWVLAGGLAGPSQATTPPAAPITVVVQPGDTVWELARQHGPSGVGTLEYAALVEQRNGVRAGALLPGSVLVLPQG
jgi:nucleoid-associated protein YgaU